MSRASKNAGSSGRRHGRDNTACEHGQLLQLHGDAADLALRAYRDEELQIREEFHDPERLRWELESIQRLRKEFGEILFNCQDVAELEGWLEGPGRNWLFERYCSAAIAEWDESVAKDQPPRVFRTGTETLSRHLDHCSFCQIARRLAEGRVRMRKMGLGELLRGDQIVDDFVTHALAEAFFRAEAPRALPYRLTRGGDGEPTSMTVLEDKSERINGQVGTLALLHGGRPEACVEVNVVWELTGPVAATQAINADEATLTDPGRLAFPNDKHPDSLVTVGADGSCLIPLVVPIPAAERGVVFKYCGRRFQRDGVRRLATLSPPNPTLEAIRTRGALKGAKPLGDAAPDAFEHAQHKQAGLPPHSFDEMIPVSVSAASFRWSG